MQVSWIDSEHLASLLNDLGEARPERETSPLEMSPTDTSEEGYTPPAGLVEPTYLPKPEPLPIAAPQMPTPAPAREKVPELPSPTADTEEEVEVENVGDTLVAPEVERIRDRLRAVRERAEAAGLLRRVVVPAAIGRVFSPAVPVEKAADAIPSVIDLAEDEPLVGHSAHLVFDVPAGSLAERLEGFANWLGEHLEINELLLLDEQGDVLWGADARADLVLSVMLAARAASRSSAAQAVGHGNVSRVSHQSLGAGKGVLSVAPCATDQGLVVIGIDSPSIVSDQQSDWLTVALKAAVEGKS